MNKVMWVFLYSMGRVAKRIDKDKAGSRQTEDKRLLKTGVEWYNTHRAVLEVLCPEEYVAVYGGETFFHAPTKELLEDTLEAFGLEESPNVLRFYIGRRNDKIKEASQDYDSLIAYS